MATEIPSQIEFQHLLAHTFPGFFSAITLFMLIDIWSPINLTALVIKDLNALISFAGFILLIGTIMGVIIDGIHHSLIEDCIFDNFKTIDEAKKELPCSHGCDETGNKCFYKKAIPTCNNACSAKDTKICNKNGLWKPGNVKHYHFFKKMELDKAKAIHEYLVETIYCYSEFYANTFTSLCFFSLVVPFYLLDVLQITWQMSISIAFFSLLLAGICLSSSYNAYRDYVTNLISVIHGCVEPCTKGSASGGDKEKNSASFNIITEVRI